MSSVEAYDGTGWRAVASLHTGRSRLAAAVLDETIYAIGGETDAPDTVDSYLKSVEVFG